MTEPQSKLWALGGILLLVSLLGQIAVLYVPLFSNFAETRRAFPLGSVSFVWALTGFVLAKWLRGNLPWVHASVWAVVPFLLFALAGAIATR